MNNNGCQQPLFFDKNTTPTAWCEWSRKYLHPLRMTLLLFTCLIVGLYLWKRKEWLHSALVSNIRYLRHLTSFLQHIIRLYLLSMNNFIFGKTVEHMLNHV